jgi:hypothetical protein
MQIISHDINSQYVVDQPEPQYYDFKQSYVVHSLYIVLPATGWKVTVAEEEATDREILRYLEKSGGFDFLKNPEEDIYGMDDGEPV